MDLLRPSLPLLRRALLAAGLCLAAPAQESSETAVKGAYLYKFGEYVEWPASALPQQGEPFVIGILGEDPFGGLLDEIVRHRRVQGRPVVIRRLKRLAQAQGIHVLYLGESTEEDEDLIRAKLYGRPILTVGEPGRHAGAVITFVLVQNKVRFEVDAEAADRARLRLSSKLMGLATAVRRASG